MKNDYLWDGSGEADPEVEELEQLLGRLRYQPKPLELPAPPRRVYWPQLAAAAAILVALAAGLWFYFQPKSEVGNKNITAENHEEAPIHEVQKPNAPLPVAPDDVIKKAAQPQKDSVARVIAPRPKRKAQPEVSPEIKEEISLASEEAITAGTRQPIVIPFLDPETTRHIERSQFLLRDFRNLQLSAKAKALDVSYEKERSKKLLGDNILLRRNAESTGNVPVEDLLGSLEPILLDIANLPEKPAADDIRAIRERIQRKEIIATLQVYSAQAVSIVQ